MKEPIRIKNDVNPGVIEKLGNNTYYCNYDIKPDKYQVVNTDGTIEDRDCFSYVQAYVHGQPNYKDCVKNTIRAFVSQEEEFDLINSANRITFGIDNEEKASNEYYQYLILVDEIKQYYKQHFNV